MTGDARSALHGVGVGAATVPALEGGECLCYCYEEHTLEAKIRGRGLVSKRLGSPLPILSLSVSPPLPWPSPSSSTTSLITQVEEHFGGALDILVNNVGRSIRKTSTFEYTTEEFDTIIDTNFKSVLLLTQVRNRVCLPACCSLLVVDTTAAC